MLRLRPIIKPNKVVSGLPIDGDRRKAWFVAADRKPPQAAKSVVSLFTGCGGMEIGLEAAGFHTAVCVEIDKDCNRTLETNRPQWKRIDPGDITDISSADILKAARLNPGQAGLVTAGCPCQPFSTMGKKEGISSDKGNLFAHFIRVVSDIRPAGFIFENVAGITKHSEVLDMIDAMAHRLDYRISARVLIAADYGVPQRRKRLIILGLRDRNRDSNIPAFPWPSHSENPEKITGYYADRGFAIPVPKTWITVQDCFDGIDYDEVEKMEARGECYKMGVSPLMLKRMKCIRPYTRDNFKSLPNNLRPPCWMPDKDGKLRHQGNDTFGRLEFGKAAVTIRTCGYHPMKGRYIHPTLNRGLNTVELARLQGFPAEWRFIGKMTSVSRQIGNAVPPPLAEALGRAMAFQISKRP